MKKEYDFRFMKIIIINKQNFMMQSNLIFGWSLQVTVIERIYY